jgi:trehalose 6-phosphate synthase
MQTPVQEKPATAEPSGKAASGHRQATKYDFMVVSNRLPVDRVSPGDSGDDGSGWRRSPGGLVTALAPMMTKTDGAWVGWHGAPDETVKPFSHGGMDLVPGQLSTDDGEL